MKTAELLTIELLNFWQLNLLDKLNFFDNELRAMLTSEFLTIELLMTTILVNELLTTIFWLVNFGCIFFNTEVQ